LHATEAVERIVVALPEGEVAAAPEGTLGVAGGQTRSQSVRSALRACGDGDPVIVHDAARPLASVRLFEGVLQELRQSAADAVVAAIPVPDTVKEVDADGRTVRATLDRSRLWAVQTPQAFRREALERVLFEASDELLAAATDDAFLVERAGGIVRVAEGSPQNIKVTSPVDLRVAELLLREGGSR
jgi:2-C-methyl-D-erythritol 4-phosphate cytidylyltransferase